MSSTYVQMRSGIRRDRRVGRIAKAIQHDPEIIDRICGPSGEDEAAACRSMPEDIAITYAVGGLQAVWDVIQQEGDEDLAHEAESLFVRDIDADELDKQAGVIGIARAMAADNVGWLVFRDGGVEAPRILERGTNIAGSKQKANSQKETQRRKSAWEVGAGLRVELPGDIYSVLDESDVPPEIENGRSGVRTRKEVDDPDGRKFAAYKAGKGSQPASSAEQPAAATDQPADSAGQSAPEADQSAGDEQQAADQSESAEAAEPAKPAGKKGGKKKPARASIRDNREPHVEGRRKGKPVLRGAAADRFQAFWDAFALKQDQRKCAEAWAQIEDDEDGIDDDLFAHIIAAAQAEASARPGKRANGLTPKYPQGWITDRRWESFEAGQEAAQVTASPLSGGEARSARNQSVAAGAAERIKSRGRVVDGKATVVEAAQTQATPLSGGESRAVKNREVADRASASILAEDDEGDSIDGESRVVSGM